MIKRLVEKFIIEPCIRKYSATKIMNILFKSWVNDSPLSKKATVISFLCNVIEVIRPHMPMFDVTLKELKWETETILNNAKSSEPRIMCPRCKALVKIPAMGNKKTLFWTISSNNVRKELNFECGKCKYKKPLGIDARLEI